MAELPFMKMKLRMTMRRPSLAVCISLWQKKHQRPKKGTVGGGGGGGEGASQCSPRPRNIHQPPHCFRFSPSTRGRVLVRM